MQRVINAPDPEWLSEREAADYLGLGLDLFRKMIRAGLIPEGKRWTNKTLRWHWETIWWVSTGLKLGAIDPSRMKISTEIEGDEEE